MQPTSGLNAIEAASHTHAMWFKIYIAILIATAVLTWIVWWTGNKVQDAVKSDADARIAEANVKSAEANERAAQASLKLEELRRQVAPRQVNRAAFLKALAGQPKATVEIMYLRDDPECFDVAQQIWQLLQAAQWNVATPVPIPVTFESMVSNRPTAMSVNGQPSGITVIAHSASEEEINASSKIIMGKDDWIRTPWTVLENAILQSTGKTNGHAGGSNSPAEGTLRVVVAPRT